MAVALAAATFPAFGQEDTGSPPPRAELLKVVATIPDIADMIHEIGGDAVDCDLLIPAGSDPHAILPKASLLLRLQRADLLILMGLDYEHSFLPALLEKVRHEPIQPGGAGYINLGESIRPLDVPDSLDRGAGADIHPRGNPHYNTDPERGRVMALRIRDALIAADPGRREEFTARWQAFDREIVSRTALWQAYLEPLRGRPLVGYHRSWSYFAERFGFKLLGEVEPKPGLRPSPKHLAELATRMRAAEAKVLMMEPWYPRSDVEKLLQVTGARLCVVPTTCGGPGGEQCYLDWLESMVDQVGQAYGRPSFEAFAAQQKATTGPTGGS